MQYYCVFNSVRLANCGHAFYIIYLLSLHKIYMTYLISDEVPIITFVLADRISNMP